MTLPLSSLFLLIKITNYFSDEVVKNRVAGEMSQNPALRKWHTKELERLPGLKWMRTLWVCSVAGGPFQYAGTKPGATQMGLEKAHFNLHISPEEFDAVAGELSKALDHYKVPLKEKSEVLAAFAAHKNEVTTGYYAMKIPT